VNWSKHQRVEHAAKYTLPPPPDTLPTFSGESREDGVRVSLSDLRPTTNDLRPPTGGGRKNGKRPTALEVGELINTVRGLRHTPVIGSTRIAKKALEESVTDDAQRRAVLALGLGRFLKDDDEYLLRDLTDALTAARSAA
jgi:hypothetical protein